MFKNGNFINKQSPLPLYYQLKQILRDKMECGEWLAHALLPSENELCKQYCISRPTVRQALADLEKEGVIYRIRGKGTFVAEPKLNDSILQSLVGFHEQVITKGKKIRNNVLEQSVEPTGRRVAKSLEIEEGTPVIKIRRLRYVDDEPFSIVTSYLPYNLCPQVLEEDFTHKSLYSVLKNNGFKIERAIRTLEPILASDEHESLLYVKQGASIHLLQSTSYLDDGRPIEFFRAMIRGDKSRFVVEIKQTD